MRHGEPLSATAPLPRGIGAGAAPTRRRIRDLLLAMRFFIEPRGADRDYLIRRRLITDRPPVWADASGCCGLRRTERGNRVLTWICRRDYDAGERDFTVTIGKEA